MHAAVLIGMFGARHNKEDGKALMVFSLMFVSMVTGFFAAADIFSFYIFFEAMLLPLFMIIGALLAGKAWKPGAETGVH